MENDVLSNEFLISMAKALFNIGMVLLDKQSSV